MTREEMWRAIKENCAACDGVFFYAVRSTGIYCRPSCRSKIPRRENVCFFETAKQAEEAGFRPCKRCRSDLPVYRPVGETAERAKRLLDDCFFEKRDMKSALDSLGVSRHHLTEIFKEEYGLTPSRYAGDLRLAEAKRLLSDTGNDITDIAYSVGFGGLSSFYRFFKKHTGMSPAAYRKEHRK